MIVVDWPALQLVIHPSYRRRNGKRRQAVLRLYDDSTGRRAGSVAVDADELPTTPWRAGQPCSCWAGPVTLHGGHCCFVDVPDDPAQPLVCGHESAGRRRMHAYNVSIAAASLCRLLGHAWKDTSEPPDGWSAYTQQCRRCGQQRRVSRD